MQKFQLSIPEPCHENWLHMQPTEQGRFCNACAKEVIDFSMMTDTEVFNYFTAITHEKVCGRALPAQLDRNIYRPEDPKKRFFWYWNYVLMFFMFFGKGNSAKAQGQIQNAPVEQLNLIRTTNKNNALAAEVKGIEVRNNKTIVGMETKIRLGGIPVLTEGRAVIYVVDGSIMPGAVEINPDDIDDYTVLDAPKAMALFGSNAASGAVIITTRKSKLKNLDTVMVSTGYNYVKGRLGGISMSYKISAYSDAKAKIITLLTDSLKVYPNPVQRGVTFSLALKLKQTGNHIIQITDAAGRIVLQKQCNAMAKAYTEKIQADNRWSSGVYYINIFNNQNRLVSKRSFIVQ